MLNKMCFSLIVLFLTSFTLSYPFPVSLNSMQILPAGDLHEHPEDINYLKNSNIELDIGIQRNWKRANTVNTDKIMRNRFEFKTVKDLSYADFLEWSNQLSKLKTTACSLDDERRKVILNHLRQSFDVPKYLQQFFWIMEHFNCQLSNEESKPKQGAYTPTPHKYEDIPKKVMLLRDEPLYVQKEEDNQFIAQRGRKQNLNLEFLMRSPFDHFIPQRGRKDKIYDIFKYDDLFIPNRGKRKADQMIDNLLPFTKKITRQLSHI